ncbi:MAG: HD domain-containing protein, partial [Pseudomonadota bacterium]|nr:HD domain-containing protein [Pseudomonadota bacterium]
DYVGKMPVDLVLTDYKMPVQDGIETILQLRSMFTYEQLPIVMTTVVSDRDVRYRAFEAGATDFLIRPVDPIECRARCQNLLNLRQQYLINSSHARVQEERVLQVTRELRLREYDILSRIARAVESRDPRNGARLQRMADAAQLIAREIGLSDDDAKTIGLAIMLHDIGMVAVPDGVSSSDAQLDAEQVAALQAHTSVGHELLRDSQSEFLQMAARLALHHHERFDGSGYPQGLSGRAIPIEARIVALVDAIEMWCAGRAGEPALRLDAALERARQQKDSRFDPELVDVLLSQREAVARIFAAAAETPISFD